MKQNDFSLPVGCVLRRATSTDVWSIRWLVFSAKLDPTQLRWQQFWVIECHGDLVACGQLRNFSDAQELGSLVVAPAWRGRGLASFLTQHLINSATQPLYLECLGERLMQFYSRFGFVPISFQELPQCSRTNPSGSGVRNRRKPPRLRLPHRFAPTLQNKFRISELGKRLIRIPVVFMYHPGHS